MGIFDPIFNNPVVGGVMGAVLPQFMNPAAQIEQRNYNRRLQSEMLLREDNAIQRRKADLISAGMSPVLSAGQGASAGPIVSSEAPRSNSGGIASLPEILMSIISQKAGVERTQADTAKVLAETENVKALKQGIGYENTIKGIDAYNAGNTGIGTPHGTISGAIKDTYSAVDKVADDIHVNAANLIRKMKVYLQLSLEELIQRKNADRVYSK